VKVVEVEVVAVELCVQPRECIGSVGHGRGQVDVGCGVSTGETNGEANGAVGILVFVLVNKTAWCGNVLGIPGCRHERLLREK